MGTFGILNNINENITLVQPVDLLVNVNLALSVVGKWIFDSNYEKALPLSIELFNFIYSCSCVDQTIAIFNVVYYAVMYVKSKNQNEVCAEVIRYHD